MKMALLSRACISHVLLLHLATQFFPFSAHAVTWSPQIIERFLKKYKYDDWKCEGYTDDWTDDWYNDCREPSESLGTSPPVTAPNLVDYDDWKCEGFTDDWTDDWYNDCREPSESTKTPITSTPDPVTTKSTSKQNNDSPSSNSTAHAIIPLNPKVTKEKPEGPEKDAKATLQPDTTFLPEESEATEQVTAIPDTTVIPDETDFPDDNQVDELITTVTTAESANGKEEKKQAPTVPSDKKINPAKNETEKQTTTVLPEPTTISEEKEEKQETRIQLSPFTLTLTMAIPQQKNSKQSKLSGVEEDVFRDYTKTYLSRFFRLQVDPEISEIDVNLLMTRKHRFLQEIEENSESEQRNYNVIRVVQGDVTFSNIPNEYATPTRSHLDNLVVSAFRSPHKSIFLEKIVTIGELFDKNNDEPGVLSYVTDIDVRSDGSSAIDEVLPADDARNDDTKKATVMPFIMGIVLGASVLIIAFAAWIIFRSSSCGRLRPDYTRYESAPSEKHDVNSTAQKTGSLLENKGEDKEGFKSEEERSKTHLSVALMGFDESLRGIPATSSEDVNESGEELNCPAKPIDANGEAENVGDKDAVGRTASSSALQQSVASDDKDEEMGSTSCEANPSAKDKVQPKGSKSPSGRFMRAISAKAHSVGKYQKLPCEEAKPEDAIDLEEGRSSFLTCENQPANDNKDETEKETEQDDKLDVLIEAGSISSQVDNGQVDMVDKDSEGKDSLVENITSDSGKEVHEADLEGVEKGTVLPNVHLETSETLCDEKLSETTIPSGVHSENDRSTELVTAVVQERNRNGNQPSVVNRAKEIIARSKLKAAKHKQAGETESTFSPNEASSISEGMDLELVGSTTSEEDRVDISVNDGEKKIHLKHPSMEKKREFTPARVESEKNSNILVPESVPLPVEQDAREVDLGIQSSRHLPFGKDVEKYENESNCSSTEEESTKQSRCTSTEEDSESRYNSENLESTTSSSSGTQSMGKPRADVVKGLDLLSHDHSTEHARTRDSKYLQDAVSLTPSSSVIRRMDQACEELEDGIMSYTLDGSYCSTNPQSNSSTGLPGMSMEGSFTINPPSYLMDEENSYLFGDNYSVHSSASSSVNDSLLGAKRTPSTERSNMTGESYSRENNSSEGRMQSSPRMRHNSVEVVWDVESSEP